MSSNSNTATKNGSFEKGVTDKNLIGALNRSDIKKSPKDITRDEWRQILTPFQYAVMKEAYTERAHSGQYVKTKDTGTYHCGACGAILFNSKAKFESRCGWPSFSWPESISSTNEEKMTNVGKRPDCTFGLVRTEIYCQQCNSHLGHLFDDGPRPSKERYCVNSAAMEFVPVKKLE